MPRRLAQEVPCLFVNPAEGAMDNSAGSPGPDQPLNGYLPLPTSDNSHFSERTDLAGKKKVKIQHHLLTLEMLTTQMLLFLQLFLIWN